MNSITEQLLADTAAADRSTIEMATLRQLRATCKEVETGLSYLRRIAQGRLDIVSAEHRRREAGEEPEDLTALVSRLAEVLSENTRSSGLGRMPQTLGTGVIDTELADELDEIAAPSVLSDPAEIAEAQLAEIRTALKEYEAKISGLRRRFFDQIDSLEAELTRRYRTGEASVDSLLH